MKIPGSSYKISCSFFIVLSLFIALPLVAQAKELDKNTVASVNGKNLSLSMYQFLLGSRQREDQEQTEFALSEDELSAIRAQATEDLILTEVLAQEALRLKVDQLDMNKIEIDLARQTLLAQLMVRQIMQNINVTEDAIRAVYDAEKSTSLYRFNLWMTPTKEEAEKLLAHLKDNKVFKHSYEKIETPWLDQTELEPFVVSLVDATKTGEFVPQTIQQDGLWKVIQLIDKNSFDKPSFEEARDVIKADLIQAQIDEEIRKLSTRADIQVNAQHIH
jgi:peptidyl-prolyl cis-trans isomerase C